MAISETIPSSRHHLSSKPFCAVLCTTAVHNDIRFCFFVRLFRFRILCFSGFAYTILFLCCLLLFFSITRKVQPVATCRQSPLCP